MRREGRRREEEERGGLRDRPWAEQLPSHEPQVHTPVTVPTCPPPPSLLRGAAELVQGKDMGVLDVANGGTGPWVCSLLFCHLR